MITYFTNICKQIYEKNKKIGEKNNEEEIYQETADRFRHHGEGCAKCGAVGKLKAYGWYMRWMVYHEEGKNKEAQIKIQRYKCESCGGTHALLPDILVPYSAYTLTFKLTVIHAYYKREKTVAKICEQFGIAISTLYAWKKLLHEHKELLMGVLESKKTDTLAFLREFLGTESAAESLRGFFLKYGFSFLQNRRKRKQSTTQSATA